MSYHTLSMSLHYLVKYVCSKNRHAQEVIEANCHVSLSHSKTVLKYFCGKQTLFNSLTKNVYINHTEKIP